MPKPQQFFERFRAEVAKYVEGVHRLGDPAPRDRVAGLPPELASFLASWNGAELFGDALTIYDWERVRREEDLWLVGETATGDRLALDPAGRVLKIEEGSGDVLVEGSTFGRWLEALVVAEEVVYDREGEFREGIFDEGGEDLTPQAALRRERKALKLDPTGPAVAWRLAKALERLGQARKAMEVLVGLLAREPEFSWAWFDLGCLRRNHGDFSGAEAAFAEASALGGDAAALFGACAARAAAERGDEAARNRHAEAVLAIDPGFVSAQKRASRSRFDLDDREGGIELLELARAVMPRDLEVMAMLSSLPRRCLVRSSRPARPRGRSGETGHRPR